MAYDLSREKRMIELYGMVLAARDKAVQKAKNTGKLCYYDQEWIELATINKEFEKLNGQFDDMITLLGSEIRDMKPITVDDIFGGMSVFKKNGDLMCAGNAVLYAKMNNDYFLCVTNKKDNKFDFNYSCEKDQRVMLSGEDVILYNPPKIKESWLGKTKIKEPKAVIFKNAGDHVRISYSYGLEYESLDKEMIGKKMYPGCEHLFYSVKFDKAYQDSLTHRGEYISEGDRMCAVHGKVSNGIYRSVEMPLRDISIKNSEIKKLADETREFYDKKYCRRDNGGK